MNSSLALYCDMFRTSKQLTAPMLVIVACLLLVSMHAIHHDYVTHYCRSVVERLLGTYIKCFLILLHCSATPIPRPNQYSIFTDT